MNDIDQIAAAIYDEICMAQPMPEVSVSNWWLVTSVRVGFLLSSIEINWFPPSPSCIGADRQAAALVLAAAPA
jgi:hypothetical protein